MKLGIYTATLNGHRKSYCKTFLEIFSSVRIDGFSLINHDGPVIFLMIEESFFKFVIVSVLRSVIGKETYGQLTLPFPAYHLQGGCKLGWRLTLGLEIRIAVMVCDHTTNMTWLKGLINH